MVDVRDLKFVRVVGTVRGAGRYCYFCTGRVSGKPIYAKLPKESDPSFMSVYDALLAARGSSIAVGGNEQTRLHSVYFIGAPGTPVKIGRTADIRGRLSALQSGFPRTLEVLALAPGLGGLERDYHRRFADSRLNGEWFEKTPEIEAEIQSIRSRFPAENKPGKSKHC